MASKTEIPLSTFVADLDQLLREAEQAFSASSSQDELEHARVKFLGARQGRFKAVQQRLGSIPAGDKPAAGKKLNEVKRALQAGMDAAQTRMAQHSAAAAPSGSFDPTIPGEPVRLGRLHPITQTIQELKDIMGRLGFTPADGPEVEDQWHNFDALNIPREHIARDPLENFYLAVARGQHEGPMLLRSQTSTVQIRVMEHTPPPVRIISLGRVYRPDTVDATHFPIFHQMEGLWVDQDVSLADLKTVLHLFATSYLGHDVPIRIRPSFFPFTEPSVEADYCWQGKWVEFGGAGVVDPNVLSAVNIDPDRYSGFAFGLGVERLCMIRHNISDIRYLYANDVRFLRQFSI